MLSGTGECTTSVWTLIPIKKSSEVDKHIIPCWSFSTVVYIQCMYAIHLPHELAEAKCEFTFYLWLWHLFQQRHPPTGVRDKDLTYHASSQQRGTPSDQHSQNCATEPQRNPPHSHSKTSKGASPQASKGNEQEKPEEGHKMQGAKRKYSAALSDESVQLHGRLLGARKWSDDVVRCWSADCLILAPDKGRGERSDVAVHLPSVGDSLPPADYVPAKWSQVSSHLSSACRSHIPTNDPQPCESKFNVHRNIYWMLLNFVVIWLAIENNLDGMRYKVSNLSFPWGNPASQQIVPFSPTNKKENMLYWSIGSGAHAISGHKPQT